MGALYVRDPRAHPVIDSLLKERAEFGIDFLDEVWEGVLHMSPPPHGEHQALIMDLGIAMKAQASRHGLGRILPQAGVREPGTPTKGPRSNFRVPDLVLIPPGYSLIDGWIEDGASLVVELRSEREVVREKLAFYADRKVLEVLYVDWRSLEIELFDLRGGRPVLVSPDREGFVVVRTLAVRARRVVDGDKRRLELEDIRGGGPLPSV